MVDVEYELKGWVEFFSKRSPFMCKVIQGIIDDEPTLNNVASHALYHKRMKEALDDEVEAGYHWSIQVFLDMMLEYMNNEDFSIYEYMKEIENA